MAMNKALQIKTIKAKIKQMGYDSDLFDVSAYIDSTITLKENWDNIKADVKYMGIPKIKKSIGGTRSIKKVERFQKAQSIFEKFSQKRQQMDSRKRARNTFEMGTLTKKNFRKWKKRPNRYDIHGVDD